MNNVEGDKREITTIVEEIQEKYFERLEKITKDYNKTIRHIFYCITFFIITWIIGYFTVALLK